MVENVILLVEDNEKDELLTIRALKTINVANRIDVVRDGQEAIDYLLGEERELPAVVILDLRLPKLDGHEVLQRLRADARTELLPVVILTSSEEKKDITESYRHGANSFVSKPVNIDKFTKAVADLGLYWLVTNKAANKEGG
jgi:hypothetical protein